ncbi:thioesterase II family protein [Paenibacillus nicotianae]|uniref:Thioesterase II family protein n=1 Tax=Paenibacillus nicotianae TaxID=1526551 RepID=A0ABW4UR55_9BACL
MKLFCIPHAGASAISYNIWKEYLDQKIHLIPLDLPGHMTRSSEPLSENINDVVYDLAQNIKKNILSNETYAVYGHSMGGLLLYLLYFYLKDQGEPLPIHLFFSSRWPPYYHNEKAYYNLDDLEECKSRIIRMGGFKQEVLNNTALTEYYMNILLADYRLMQSVSIKEIKQINSDITVLWSDNEPDIIDKDIYTWRESAGNNISFVKIKGTHFFPTEEPLKTTNIINYTLKKYS